VELRDFFAIPNIVIDSGLWALMKRSEQSVYVVLCRYRNYKTNRCFPGIKTISKLSGVHRNNVCSALKQLCIYSLIGKKRAPRGLKFRNIYTIIMNPNIDPSTFPQKAEKECKQNRDEKTGKFRVCPQSAEKRTLPQDAEAVRPHKMEKKESKMKESLKKDSFLTKPHLTYSIKTLKELMSAKGKDWLIEELGSKGYTEDQINSSLKEIEKGVYRE